MLLLLLLVVVVVVAAHLKAPHAAQAVQLAQQGMECGTVTQKSLHTQGHTMQSARHRAATHVHQACAGTFLLITMHTPAT
jgi:hypothetical protein